MDIEKLHKELVNRCRYNKVQDDTIIEYVSDILNHLAIDCDDIKLAGKICHDLHYTYGYKISQELLTTTDLIGYNIVINSSDKLVSIKQIQEIITDRKRYSFSDYNFVYDLLTVASSFNIPNIEALIFGRRFYVYCDVENDKYLSSQISKYNEYLNDISFTYNGCILNSKIECGISLKRDKFLKIIDFVGYMKEKNGIENAKVQTLECKIKNESNNNKDMCSVQYSKNYIILDKCYQYGKSEFVSIVLNMAEIISTEYDLNNCYTYDYYLLTVTFINDKTLEFYISRGDYNILQKCFIKQ